VALRRFQLSALWQSVSTATKIFTEVPVGISSSNEKPADAIRGVIDLVYLGEAGWKIVDYKTDVAHSEAEIRRLERKYTPQIEEYARYWTQVTGDPADADLWFVHGLAPAEQFTLF
jgi:ATP-dependent exoDNAse (exonuclease V) beta subunit